MKGPRRCATLIAALVGLMATGAASHLMPASHGTLNVVGTKAYAIVSLPVSAFQHSGARAAVQDGVLTAIELKANQAALRTAVREGLQITVAGQPATVSSLLLNLPTGADHAPDQGTELTVMMVVQLPGPPKTISIRSTLWATQAPTLTIDATDTLGRHVLRREVHALTPDAPEHTFFVVTATGNAAPATAASAAVGAATSPARTLPGQRANSGHTHPSGGHTHPGDAHTRPTGAHTH